MAIITCPECNEKISDTTNQCIHCGAKITVCPECGGAFAADFDRCPVCGYIIKQKPITEESAVNNQTESTEDIVKYWSSGNFMRKLWNEKSMISRLINNAWSIFFWISLIELTNMANPLNYVSIVNSIDSYILLAAFIAILSSIIYTMYAQYYAYLNFFKWTKTYKKNCINAINNDLSQDLSTIALEELQKKAPYWNFVLKSELYSNNISARSKKLTFNFIKIILTAISAFFLASFASGIVNTIIPAWAWMGSEFEFEFSMIPDWWKAIASLATALVIPIYDTIVTKKIEKLQLELMNETMPQNIEKYNTYIKNVDAYVVEKKFGSDNNAS